MRESTRGSGRIWLMATLVVTLVSFSFAYSQWQIAERANTRAAAALHQAKIDVERARSEKTKTKVAKDVAQTAVPKAAQEPSESEVIAPTDAPNVKNESPSEFLEPANVVRTYQELAKGYVAQSQTLKTAQTRGRQRKALKLLQRAVEVRAITRDIARRAQGQQGDLWRETNDFWVQQIPAIRNEAIDWMGQASFQPINQTDIAVPTNQSSQSTTPRLAIHGERELLAVLVSPAEIQLRSLETSELLSSISLKVEANTIVAEGSLEFSADGKQLIYCTHSRYSSRGMVKLHILDVDSKQHLKTVSLTTLQQYSSKPPRFSFNPNKQVLLINTRSEATLWDVSDGRQIRKFSGVGYEFGNSNHHVFQHNHRLFARTELLDDSAAPTAIKAIDIHTGRTTAWSKIGHADTSPDSHSSIGRAGSVVTPDRKWLLSTSQERSRSGQSTIQLTVVKTKSGAIVRRISIESTESYSPQKPFVRTMASSDSRFAIIATTTQVVVVEIPSGRIVQQRPHPKPGGVAAAAPRPGIRSQAGWTSATICQTDESATLALLLIGTKPDRRPTGILQIWDAAFPVTPGFDVAKHADAVNSVRCALIDDAWASCDTNGSLQVWGDDNSETWSHPALRSSSLNLGPRQGFGGSGEICFLNLSSRVQCWNTATGKMNRSIDRKQIIGANSPQTHLAIKARTSDSKRAIVQIYDAVTDQFTTTFKQPEWASVESARFSSSGKLLIGFSTGAVLIGNVESGATIKLKNTRSLDIPSLYGTSLIIDRADKRVLIAKQQSSNLTENPPTLTVYEVDTGEIAISWQAPATKDKYDDVPRLEHVSFSPAGKYVTFSRKIDEVAHAYLWACQENEEPVRLERPFKGVGSLRVTDQGNVLINGVVLLSKDGKVVIEAKGANTGGLGYPSFPPAAINWRLASYFGSTSHPQMSDTAIISSQGPDRKYSTAFWDLQKAELLRAYPQRLGHRSPDNRYCVLVDDKRQVTQMIDLRSGETHMSLNGSAIGFSQDSRYLMTRDPENQALICWNVTTKKRIALEGGVDTRNSSLIKCSNNTVVAYDSSDASFRVWNIKNNSKGRSLRIYRTNYVPGAGSAKVEEFQLSLSGEHLLAEINGQVRLYALNNDECLVRMPRTGHSLISTRTQAQAGAVCIDPINGIVGSSGLDQTVCFWDLKTGRFRGMLEGFSSPVIRLSFLDNGRQLLSLERSGRIMKWNAMAQTKDSSDRLAFESVWSHASTKPGEVATPGSWTLSHDQKMVAHVEGQDLIVRNTETGEVVQRVEVAGDSPVQQLAFLRQGEAILVSQQNGLLSQWQVETADCVSTLETDHSALASFSFTPDEKMLVTVGKMVRLWNLDSGEFLLEVDLLDGAATWSQFSDSGQRHFVAGANGTIVTWKPEEYRSILEGAGLAWSAAQTDAVGAVDGQAADNRADDVTADQPRPPVVEPNPVGVNIEAAHDPQKVWEFHRRLHRTVRNSEESSISRFVPPQRLELTTVELIELARDANADLTERMYAIHDLGLKPDDSKKIIPVLVELIDSEQQRIASAAISAIGQLGEKSVAAIPKLLEVARGLPSSMPPTRVEIELRRPLVRALASIGAESIPHLRILFDDEDVKMRRLAALVSQSMANNRQTPAVELVGELTAALADEIVEIQIVAARTLGQIAVDASAAVPALRELVNSDTPSAQLAACVALWNITGDPEESLPALINLLSQDDQSILIPAIRQIGIMGNQAGSAVSELERLLESKISAIRIASAESMAHVSPLNEELIPILISSLREGALTSANNFFASRTTISAIGETISAIGELGRRHPEKTVPLVLDLLGDFRTRSMAIQILGGIGSPGKAAIPDLVELTRDGNGNIRFTAVQALIKMEQAGLLAMTEVLREPDFDMFAVSMAKSLLVGYGVDPDRATTAPELKTIANRPDGSQHAPWLVDLLNRPNHQTAGAALCGLVFIGEPALPTLTKALADPRSRVRSGAALALGAISTTEAETLLLQTADDTDPAVRWSVVTALAQISNPSDEVIARLRGAQKDPDSKVRIAAEAALNPSVP
ncbi:MAG: HEAT repeat domain-containing protein [Fuerstiella sp.]